MSAARSRDALLISVAVILACAVTAGAQGASDRCRPAGVIPLTGEPPAKIIVDPPLAEPLAARGVAIIQYCAENLHLLPVFGPGALTVSPRVGHLHVRLDDAEWVWADASGSPIILMGLQPGPHRVTIELEDANHHALDKGTVAFVVPEKSAAHPVSPSEVKGMIITSIQYTFAAKDADKAESLFQELRAASVKEPGVIRFEVGRSIEDPNVFALWELYRDKDAADAHRESEHFKRLVINGIRPLAKQRNAATVVPIHEKP